MFLFFCAGRDVISYVVWLALSVTGKNVLLKIAGGWHGANSELSSGIKMPYDKRESLGLLPELEQYTKVIPFNDLPDTLGVIHQNRNDLAGIILEPVIGEGGFIPATQEYLKMLRTETEHCGALLIFDEVISGFRTSLGGAQKRFNITPDLTTLGKIMGGGLPVGALVGKREIVEKTSPERKGEKWEKILIGGGTFSSHPLTVASGLAMLNYLRDHEGEVYPPLEVLGEKVRKGVRAAFQRRGVDAVVTGIGSLYQTHFPHRKGVTLSSPHTINHFTDTEKREVEFRIRMLAKGVHVMHGGGALSITHSEEDIARIVRATEAVAEEMAAERV